MTAFSGTTAPGKKFSALYDNAGADRCSAVAAITAGCSAASVAAITAGTADCRYVRAVYRKSTANDRPMTVTSGFTFCFSIMISSNVLFSIFSIFNYPYIS